MRRGTNLVLMFVLGVAGIALAATPAAAQPAAALGKPLPSSDLPAGTVSVRVVAGSTSIRVCQCGHRDLSADIERLIGIDHRLGMENLLEPRLYFRVKGIVASSTGRA